ncbi:MAG: tyrosine-type recombinase/integrase [Clostridiales bacterium]|jgi:integrase|nr:tyrosine-type recombinase/integrase [Clostridiales bacterium]
MPAKAKYKKRPDGRYMRLLDAGRQPGGARKRLPVYGYTIEELDANYVELKNSLAKGTYASDGGWTVAQWAAQWLETYKSGKELNTRGMYAKAIAHIVPAVGHLRLRDVRQFALQGLVNGLAEKGLTRTVEIVARTLRQIFEAAADNELIPKNPARKLDVPAFKAPKKKAMDSREIACYLNERLTAKQRAYVAAGIYAGLRKGELLALQRGDVDFGRDEIRVTKSVVFDGNRAVLKPYPKTDASVRAVPMPPQLRLAMEAQAAAADLMLFPARGGGPMSLTAYRRMWESVAGKANLAAGGRNGKSPILAIRRITSHTMRHTYATLLYYAGVDVKQAQAWLGHASIQMTLDVYTHLDEKGTKEAKEKYAKFLYGSQMVVGEGADCENAGK